MDTIKNILNKIIELFCIGIMGIMTLLVSWQVFTRYFFNKPSAITEQLSQYLFVWLVLYGAAYVFGKREHMKISFIRDRVPNKIGILFDFIQEIIIAFFALSIMVYGGFLSTMRQMVQMDASLQIPIGVVYSAIPISGVFIIFYSLYNLINISKKKI
ncbi:MAG: TRAP transporter small permease [Cetobacterium sp.]|uniref:TRAP transporter small permease n=2 Tax=Cetobacterium sp. TaxID=2071632 RepID=UPI002FC7BF5B